MSYKKTKLLFIILLLFVLLFIEKCSLINLSTASIFQSKAYDTFKNLRDTIQSENYEIVPINASFPILFDSIKNEFYLKNNQGLTKIDANGQILFSSNLLEEKYTSVFDFANFSPYVFARNGVYDFSEDQLKFYEFSAVLNENNELNDTIFKAIFEKSYKEASLVLYETNRNIDYDRECYPIYFKIDNNWNLLFTQKGEHRLTHQLSSEQDDIIGQIDFEQFPAKFDDKRLMVLKDFKHGIYSTKQTGEKINDAYLDMYYSQILNERKLNYETTNAIEMLSYKKGSYYSSGSFFNLPEWVNPTFLNTAYFELTFNNEKMFFKEKALKPNYRNEHQSDLYLYELPKHLRKRSKVAFLDYNLNLGGYSATNSDSIIPINKNAGLYLIRPKKH